MNDPAMFIALREEKDVASEALALDDADKALPLYGIPVAVKDNIDVKGFATTAACPAFSYHPKQDATVGGAAARRRRAHSRQDQSRSVRDRPGRRALALRHAAQPVRRESSFPAARAPARALRSAPASCRWRSAPIPRDPAACPPPTIILSGSNRASGWFRPLAWFRPAARSTASRCSRSPSTTR